MTFAETGDTDEWEDHYFDDTTTDICDTRDELELFDGSSWNERRGREDFEIEGHKCIHWAMAKARKGDKRISLTVIDLGGLRLIYQM